MLFILINHLIISFLPISVTPINSGKNFCFTHYIILIIIYTIIRIFKQFPQIIVHFCCCLVPHVLVFRQCLHYYAFQSFGNIRVKMRRRNNLFIQMLYSHCNRAFSLKRHSFCYHFIQYRTQRI